MPSSATDCRTGAGAGDSDLLHGFPNVLDAPAAAHEALRGYSRIEYLLEGAGLNISLNKTGYLASSAEVRKCSMRRADDRPHVENLMKDLGLDSSGARRRRVAAIKKRLMKGKKRLRKMMQLRIQQRPVKVRLWKGSIHSAVSTGPDSWSPNWRFVVYLV